MANLNNTIDQTKLTYIQYTICINSRVYTFFSNGAFSRIDHMLGQKTIFSKLKKIEIKPGIFSNYVGTKLEIKRKWEIHEHLETKQHCPEQPMD